MKQLKLGFIGAGNLASSLLGGLIADGHPPEQLMVADIDENRRDQASEHGIGVSTDNNAVAAWADVLILAVKPQSMQSVCKPLALTIADKQPLIISVAAGINVYSLERWLGNDMAIVRCMPNTPALVRSAATGLFANNRVSSSQKDQAERILRAVGLALWVEDEALIDVVTALSGSGPAYYFMFMEAMEAAAIQLGLDAGTARLLTEQTALGAARMAIEANMSPGQLRQKVTSPGGTTEQAVLQFEKGGLHELVLTAMTAAKKRAGVMANELGAAS